MTAARKRGLNRRQFLRAAGIAGLVGGFDPLTRRWATMAEAASATLDPLPSLDGRVAMDDASLGSHAMDSGHALNRRPWAVLFPGSVDDISKMVRYCSRHALHAAARGQGHTMLGQSLVEGGLVVDMSTLAAVHSIDPHRADVGAGLVWNPFFRQTVAQGLTPPVMTSFIGLSVGGTLSVGGVPTLNRRGRQVDHARALQVVTGTGEAVWCSARRHAELFNGVLGGLGQLGIITRAVIDLVPAPARVRTHVLQYLDPLAFVADLRLLLERGEIDAVFGMVASPGPTTEMNEPTAQQVAALGPLAPALNLAMPKLGPLLGAAGEVVSVPPGTWVYLIQASSYYNESPPDQATILRGTSDLAEVRRSNDQSYAEWILRVDALVDLLKEAGLWYGVPHPWWDVFVPDEAFDAFFTETMSSLHFDDVGAAGLILLFPLLRQNLIRPLPRVPDRGRWVFEFGIDTSAPGPGPQPEWVAAKLARNRRLYERARALGAKLYPIGSVEMTPTDWEQHFGVAGYRALSQLKRRYDPAGILTPGPQMFSR